eukprot:1564687-Amphidinium_carterae.1
MGTEHIKDILHLGGMELYEDDGYATQEGVEKIYTTDYENDCTQKCLRSQMISLSMRPSSRISRRNTKKMS